jgi:hypothetical protein
MTPSRFRFPIWRLMAVVTLAALAFGGVAAWRRPKDGPSSGPSRTAQEARQLAFKAFGPGHWAARDARVMYYSPRRGYWLYAQDYVKSGDGSTVEMRPVALIWRSRDGRRTKTATGDLARFRLDSPAGAPEVATELTPIHLEGNVQLREDRASSSTIPGSSVDPLQFLEVAPGDASSDRGPGDGPQDLRTPPGPRPE